MQKWLISLIVFVWVIVPVTAQDSPLTRSEPPDAAQFTLEPIASGFQRALYVTHAGDDSGRLFVVQQNGLIRTIAPDGTILDTPFLDLSENISPEALGNGYSERGLLGLAFHPDYAENGQFFVNFTEIGSHDSILARYTVSDDPDLADVTSQTILMRVPQPFGNHNGGHIAFGPDDYLYISLGDGGSAGDPLNSGQQPDTLLGTILRVDVNSDEGYRIPPDNPFVGDATGADEVWAYGLRNVWRFSFDPLTGDMYLGDVGQNRWEEINVQAAGVGGVNYGWNVLEASSPSSGAPPPANAVAPVAEYQHINGHCSVTGGYLYRGEAVPTLQQAYIYGDFCSGQLWSMYRTPGGDWASSPLTDTPYTISSFGIDATGELYLVDYGQRGDGTVYRFAPAG